MGSGAAVWTAPFFLGMRLLIGGAASSGCQELGRKRRARLWKTRIGFRGSLRSDEAKPSILPCNALAFASGPRPRTRDVPRAGLILGFIDPEVLRSVDQVKASGLPQVSLLRRQRLAT